MTWENSAFKFKLAVPGYLVLNPEIARKTVYEAGLWPMNFQLLYRSAASQASENLPEPLSSSFETQGRRAVRDSPIGEIRSDVRYLLAKIRHFQVCIVLLLVI